MAAEPFVRVPTAFLEALLRLPLSGGQWRILGWIIRQTWGWNREKTAFSWYRIARDVRVDRSALFRAGRQLVATGILSTDAGWVGIQSDADLWDRLALPATRVRDRETLLRDNVARRPQKTMPGNHSSVAAGQQNRGCGPSPFRRVKDRWKDTPKTSKDWGAGAARPIPGKYDRLSEN
jgi:phage replication O-like protein O